MVPLRWMFIGYIDPLFNREKFGRDTNTREVKIFIALIDYLQNTKPPVIVTLSLESKVLQNYDI